MNSRAGSGQVLVKTDALVVTDTAIRLSRIEGVSEQLNIKSCEDSNLVVAFSLSERTAVKWLA